MSLKARLLSIVFFLGLLTAFNASAAIFNLGTLGPGSTPISNSDPWGTVHDEYLFSLSGQGVFTLNIDLSGLLEYASFDLRDGSDTTSLLSGPLPFGPALALPADAVVAGSTTLGPGDYRLHIDLFGVGFPGSYSGDITIGAVPEPSTWLLMLGGIGMLVMMRKRRA